MRFEHTVVVDAPLQSVAEFLDDVPAAARCVPGVEEAIEVEADTYDGRMHVTLGPIGFSFTGRMHVQRGDGVWRLAGDGRDSRIGAGVSAGLEARLTELAAEQTEVHVTADVQFSGRLAELGQPLIRRKTEAMVREFAQNLKRAFADGPTPSQSS